MNAKKLISSLLLGASTATLPGEVLSIRKPVGELDETPLGAYTVRPEFKNTNIPETLELRYVPPVKNQDPLGTCTIFTATGLYETHHPLYRMSEAEFAVYAETQIDDCWAGINLGRTLQLAQKDGFIPESHGPSYQHAYVPYVASLNNVNTRRLDWRETLRNLPAVKICHPHQSTKTAYDSAMGQMGSSLSLPGLGGQTSHRLGSLIPLYHVSGQALSAANEQRYMAPKRGTIGRAGAPDLDQVKLAIASGHPVAVAADVYDNCWKPNRWGNYKIKFPDLREDERQGSHAFMLTGYSGDYFRVRNSWSEEWADKGYAWISALYLRRFATEIVAVGG